MNQELLFQYYKSVLGEDWKSRSPVPLSGLEVVEALFPLNAVFKNNYVQSRSLPYLPELEGAADMAQKKYVFDGYFGPLGTETLRVILERQQQAMTVAMLNEAAGNPPMVVPEGLPKEARTGAAILFFLQEMRLPFPVDDRGNYVPDQP